VNAKSTIKKILFVTVWLCIGAGMFILLLAAISNKKRGHCSQYAINVKGSEKNSFIDAKDVEALLMKATKGKIKDQPVSSFNLFELEAMLEDNTWVSKAELYFDSQDVLHVMVTEKEPVARIFTIDGNSFYIDSIGRKIPLSDKMSARVPVFTGFTGKKKLNSIDSILFNNVRTTANYIMRNPFWLAQVAQIDITPDRNFEMIPVVGNHLVKIGDGDNIEMKFKNLKIFYTQVLSKTGFDKYKIIDVRFRGQVVASKQIGNENIDSIQLRKNVEKLLQQSIEAETDTVLKVSPSPVKLEKDPEDDGASELNAIEINIPEKIPNPNPLKSSVPTPASSVKQTVEKSKKGKIELKNKDTEVKKIPKAIMPKRELIKENKNNNQ